VQGVVAETQTPTHCNLIGCSVTAPPTSYRPTVFFGHLLVAVSFPKRNIQGGFKNFYISILLPSYIFLSLKLRKMKLWTAENVCVSITFMFE
jgi:hypothetical protein